MGTAAMTQPVFGVSPPPSDLRAFNRALGWSFAMHVVVLAIAIVAPRIWPSRRPAHPTVMTISLGGASGPRTTGMTPIGGKTVEQVAPPPKRIEAVKPPSKAPPAPAPAKNTQVREVTNTVQTLKPPPTRAVQTGRQVAVGNTIVDTGSKGLGAGLTIGGGGGTAGETEIRDFCCPEYLNDVVSVVGSHWNKNVPERGTTKVKFTITRDGKIVDAVIEQSSGMGYLDRLATSALQQSTLPPLPPEFKFPTLVIHLTFPYNGLP